MRAQMRRLNSLLALFGLDPGKTVSSIEALPLFMRDLRKLKDQLAHAEDAGPNAKFAIGKLYPCLEDRSTESGSASGHYFHQDLLVARRVFLNNPAVHVDVGSRVDGFVAHVASFRPIKVLDIRNISAKVPNIEFVQADVMHPLPDELRESCDSLSCLHALEHFGLGRYSDPVIHDGYRIGLDNMYDMLRRGGKFYLSVPVGPQRIEFNAHRVFSLRFLLELLSGRSKVDQFSFVDDQGDLHEDVPLDDSEVERNFGCSMGCGIFELTKR